MTATINTNATGLWSAREGESVTVVAVAPNGLATAILRDGASKPVYVPSRWLDGAEPEPKPSLESFVFDYVNERDPDLVAAAIEAWEARP